MPLWYKPVNRNNYSTMDLVHEFLDIWLQTRRAADINSGELAGVIDVLYEVEPSPGKWRLVEVSPKQLKNYIRVYIRSDGSRAPMMRKRDIKLSSAYKNLLKKGHKPTPIMLAGTQNENGGEEGIILIDGRHRIHSAADLGIEKMEAYIPNSDIGMFRKATL
jgi:hypothetical protein